MNSQRGRERGGEREKTEIEREKEINRDSEKRQRER